MRARVLLGPECLFCKSLDAVTGVETTFGFGKEGSKLYRPEPDT